MANNSKISAKKALPGGQKKGESFTKRSGAKVAEGARRSLKGDEDYGPRTSGRIGATVGDDGAGTRSVVGLPPETTAMKAPEAELPSAATELASATLPVPGVWDKRVGSVASWDEERDSGLRKGSK